MRILKFLMVTLLVSSLASCRHKDFCWDHPHGDIYVEVEYDDDNDPDDIEHLKNNVKATRLLAYHHLTGEHVLASDIDRKTNVLAIDVDTYHFIAYNAGTEYISFSDREEFFTHGATTRECDILEPLYDSRAVNSDIDLGNGESVVIPAEPLWSIGAEAVKCNLGDTIRLEAIPLHCRYSFEMRNIEGLVGISRISSFITGMARGATLGSTELHDTPVTVAVPAAIGKDGKSVVGNFFCFGQNPRINTRHRMGLFIEMENGKKYKLLEGDHFDVTDQVISAENRRRVHIIIDGVKIPDSGTGAGFEITVSPWGDGENLDIGYDF